MLALLFEVSPPALEPEVTTVAPSRTAAVITLPRLRSQDKMWSRTGRVWRVVGDY